MSSFWPFAALHALMIYHLLDGMDLLAALANPAYIHPNDILFDENRPSVLPEYLRLCLAAALLGGHVCGTARRELLGGRHPLVGGVVLIVAQLATVWCLFAAVWDRGYMPSSKEFFGGLGLGLVWCCYVHVETLFRRWSRRRRSSSGSYDSDNDEEKGVRLEEWVDATHNKAFQVGLVDEKMSFQPARSPENMLCSVARTPT